MTRPIQSALLSVYSKEGLESLAKALHQRGVALYSTGGTQAFLEGLGLPCNAVENVTGYPSILGGRVKTLHPRVFGGILARRSEEKHQSDVAEHELPLFDLVVVDLYPFEETVRTTTDEQAIIEKIDIGGVSLLRAAAKNFEDVSVLSSPADYRAFVQMLEASGGTTTMEDRKRLAAKAFAACAHYDVSIAEYFNKDSGDAFQLSVGGKRSLRYGENPHQSAAFYGDMDSLFEQLHGKELSYNNLVDIDAACQLVAEFEQPCFAVVKHTNPCGIAERENIEEAWAAAHAGDPESAFGGVLVANRPITRKVAEEINAIFFEVLVAPDFEPDALEVLQSKKNRILLRQKAELSSDRTVTKTLLNGVLVQSPDNTLAGKWEEAGGRNCTDGEKADLEFANAVCKHLKSNAIALVKHRQLIGKGCGQTSRIDSLRHALAKAGQIGFDTKGAVMASDAFFPFDDCARIADEAGITAVIQPGGSIRDADTVNYCKERGLALVLTGTRHFKH
jgi:phosphoribosylaminoimidazolecarboxamide formyltransferase/IMP cyclohydrolase